MTKLIDIELPFGGFYESIPDSQIDGALEMALSDDNGDLSEERADAIFMADVNWKKIENEYCEALVDQWSDALDIKLEYDTFTSPREYNFSTDRLFCKAPLDAMTKIRAEVEKYPEWPGYIKDHFTSYDGFWSNYSSDYKHEDWTKSDLDACQWEVIIEVYAEHNGIDRTELECEVNCYELSTIDEAAEVVEQYIKDQVKETK